MPSLIHPPALLALEDGRLFRGFSFGAMGTCQGEICFNTSMSGYQEVLTDPSYRGQMVAMTYPLVGNYGTNQDDCESGEIHLRGFIIEETSDISSNWRSELRLQEYLQRHHVVAISGVDTRSLTKHLRISGVMRACLTTELMSDQEAVALAKATPFLEESDLVKEVSTKEIYEWDPAGNEKAPWGEVNTSFSKKEQEPIIVAYDFGVKKNILRLLRSHGMRVMVVPALTSAQDVLAMNPDGIFFSNGPGDPAKLSSIHQNARLLADHKPVFGICLGLQILGHAFGASTFKLKFGHRGANQPVQDLRTGKVMITSQNHGYAIDEECLPLSLEVTHRHLNDRTVAGLAHREKPLLAVQFHPEASPGPHDSLYLFEEFRKMIASRAG
ncbi:MAG: glutamine-hydrolyzing carbamoyl-phosphate synthase small subunit [Verrucomicrobia bacterium]|nr:MAG: glutamine-hydrolyzing carbamoyl-phosphate synthase small subunit [Verrucomicrobiota bacterium]